MVRINSSGGGGGGARVELDAAPASERKRLGCASRLEVILQRMSEMLRRQHAWKRRQRPALLDMQQAGLAKREHESIRMLLESAPRAPKGVSVSLSHKRGISESDEFSAGGSEDTSPASSGSSHSPMSGAIRNVRPRSPSLQSQQAPPHGLALVLGKATEAGTGAGVAAEAARRETGGGGGRGGAAELLRPARRVSTWTEPSASGWDCGNPHCELRNPNKTERDFDRLPDAMLQCRHCHSLCGSAMEDNFTETRVSGSAAEEGKSDLRRADDPHARTQRAGLSSEMPDVSRSIALSIKRASESALRAHAGDASCADHSGALNRPAATLEACKAAQLPDVATRTVIERVAEIFDHITVTIAPRRQGADSNQREAHAMALEAFYSWTRRVVVADARAHCQLYGGRLDIPAGNQKALARCCPKRVAHFVIEQLVARHIVRNEMRGHRVYEAYWHDLERRLETGGTFLIAGASGDSDNNIKMRIGRALKEIVPCSTANAAGTPSQWLGSTYRDSDGGRDRDRFGVYDDGEDEDDEYDDRSGVKGLGHGHGWAA